MTNTENFKIERFLCQTMTYTLNLNSSTWHVTIFHEQECISPLQWHNCTYVKSV